jgi:hypothetical protein
MMSAESGDVELVEPVGYLGTNRGVVDVLLGQSPAYYQLAGDREDFEQQFAILLASWRSQSPVRATIRGTTILRVERT